jgi:hypothetical protein
MLTTPLQMANAMAVICNKGYYYTPHFVERIEGDLPDDTSLTNPYRRKHEVLTGIPDTAYRADAEADNAIYVPVEPADPFIEAIRTAREIGAEVVLKATKVDGVYSADPKKDPSATRYASITFDEAISQHLQVMDATAFALCRDQKLPIKVFSIVKAGALQRVVMGEDEGTLVHV